MATEQEIAEGINSLFQEISPNSFNSLNDVVSRLQSKLGGLDLSHKVDFIRAHINLLFNNPQMPRQQHQVLPHQQHQVLPHQQHQVLPHQQHGMPHLSSVVAGPTQISFAQRGPVPGRSVVVDPVTLPPKPSNQPRPKRRGGPGGLNKLCGVSPLLQTIVGQPAMPRTEIVRQLWAYIRKHNLQDPSNKRKIICNDELRLVFETDSTDMFQMNKLLAKHIVALDATKDPGEQSKKLKVEDSQIPSTDPSPITTSCLSPAAAPAATPAPAATAASCPTPAAPLVSDGTTAPVPASTPIVISEALAKFFGTNEKVMLQLEVFRRIEEYIKMKGLEDQSNSVVMCDKKLQELLGCESISTPGICEMLARDHLFQRT